METAKQVILDTGNSQMLEIEAYGVIKKPVRTSEGK